MPVTTSEPSLFVCLFIYVFDLDRAWDHIHTVEPSMKGLQFCKHFFLNHNQPPNNYTPINWEDLCVYLNEQHTCTSDNCNYIKGGLISIIP